MFQNGRFWLVGAESQPPASIPDTDHYRQQMRSLFGCAKLPPVVYKGNLIPAREL
jgi:hypothetical protein